MTPCWTDLELAALALERDANDDDGVLEVDDANAGTDSVSGALDPARRAHAQECAACAASLERLLAATRALAKLSPIDLAGAPPPPAVWEQIEGRIEQTAASERLAPDIKVVCTYCKGRLEGRARHCGACLGAHHDDCWEEHGRCAACGATIFVRAESSTGARRPGARVRSATLLLAGALVGVGAAALAHFASGPKTLTLPSGVSDDFESHATPTPNSIPLPVRNGSGISLITTTTGADAAPVERISRLVGELERPGPQRFGRAPNVVTAPYVDTPLAFDQESGTFVLISRNGYAFGLGKKGTEIWKTQIGEFGDPTPAAAIIPGRGVIIAGSDGVVHAIDLETGAVVWTESLRSPVTLAPVIAPTQDSVLVATTDGELIAFDLAGAAGGGRIQWTISLEPLVQPPLFVKTPRGLVVLAATRDETLHEIEARTGSPLGVRSLGAAITAGPIVAGGRILVGLADGRVISSESPTNPQVSSTTAVFAAPITDLIPVGNDSVAVATADTVSILDARALEHPRVIANREHGWLVRGKRLYLVSTTGEVVALDPASGRETWTGSYRSASNGPIRLLAAPVLAGDLLCAVGVDQGQVFGLPTLEPE